MEFVPVLATVVLIATLATLILGVFTYIAFRVRETRQPSPHEAGGRKQFFVRLSLAENAESAADQRG